MEQIVELSVAQKSEVAKRIDQRLNGKLGLNLKVSHPIKSFSDDLQAVQVDLSFRESDGEILGTKYTQTVIHNGESAELQYTEAQDVWLYQLNKIESNKDVIAQMYKRFKDSEDYDAILTFIQNGGYDLALDSQKVLNVEQYSFDEESQQSTKNYIQAWTVDVMEKDEVIGALVFGENGNTLIRLYKNEGVVVINEATPVIVPLDSKGKWKACMADCIGCGTWQSCVSAYSCLGACASCLNPISCVFCLVCAIASSTCLWRCRMCVANSARPEECPV